MICLRSPPRRGAASSRAGRRGGHRPPPAPEEFGRHLEAVAQVRIDRQAILKIMDRLPSSERKLLPDVGDTVDKLLHRAEALARALAAMTGDVDSAALARIDEKLEGARRQPESLERDRQVNLLERQRQALGDLVSRRRGVEEQLDSCVIAMQNVRFDLLRLRSAGVAAVLSDLTQATQQARSLSRDVDHAIAAAGEIRDLLGDRPTP